MSNEQAANKFVAIVRGRGWLEDIDESRVVGFVSMAAELDRDPGNASLWKAFWLLEDELRGTAPTDDGLDAINRELAELGPSGPPVGDET
jgi:hypothetical protein